MVGNDHKNTAFPSAVLMLLLAFMIAHAQASHAAESPSLVNAFSVTTLPKSYPGLEAFFASLNNTGANTLIMDIPMTEAGFPAISAIPNTVYLAHKAGLKLYVVLPSRRIPGPISQHKEWEDIKYDLATETYSRSGKLDLFHQPAAEYIAALAKDLAAYSVDAILLGPDFSYGPEEGMGRTAENTASQKLGSDIHPSKLYRRIEQGPEGPFVRHFTELFQRWTAIKRDRLLEVYQLIRKSVRSVSNTAKVGIPVPITYPIMNTGDIFSRYALDMNALRNIDVDYFWANIAYREMQQRQGLSYRQTMELASRLAHAAVTASRNGSRTIMILPMTDDAAPHTLPYSETEEVTSLIKQAGETGIAFGIRPGIPLNREFTNKLFRR